MNRWDPLNGGQLKVLNAIADGSDLRGERQGPDRTCARALASRGLVKIRRNGKAWSATITDEGRYYLVHGHHPAHPKLGAPTSRGGAIPAAATSKTRAAAHTPRKRSTSTEKGDNWTVAMAARRRAEAEEMLTTLQKEGIVTIDNATASDLATWRKVVDFAKRHQMVPKGRYLEKQGRIGGMIIRLVAGVHANQRRKAERERPQVVVPQRLGRPHRAVAALRDHQQRLQMSKPARERALLVLQAIATECDARGHAVTATAENRFDSYPETSRRRRGYLDITINEFCYQVVVDQEFPQSPNPEKSRLLTLEMRGYRFGNSHRWTDRKTAPIESHLGALLDKLTNQPAIDRQHAINLERAEQRRAERWTAAMADAREQAIEQQQAETLAEQAQRWQHASVLRAYSDALAARIDAENTNTPQLDSAKAWLEWIRMYLSRIDPLTQLPTMPEPAEPKPDQLKPFLKGWSPHGPEASSWNRW